MNGSTADRHLLQILKAPPPTEIAGVVAAMQAIDNLLASGDGLKWFNLLYLNVTQKVDTQPPPGGWERPFWLSRLDVTFAGLYFIAVTNWLAGSVLRSLVLGKHSSRRASQLVLTAFSLRWRECTPTSIKTWRRRYSRPTVK
jgi:hypothetical protein